MTFRNIDMNYKTLLSHSSSLKEHFHNGYEIIFIEKGKSKFTIEDNLYEYEKNTILFLNHLEEHKMDLLEIPYSRYIIIVDDNYLDNYLGNHKLLSVFKNRASKYRPGFKINEEDVDYVMKVLVSLNDIFIGKKELWEIEFISLFASFMVFLYRNYTSCFPHRSIDDKSKRILDIQQYIDRYFKDNLTLESVADRFFISKYYLAHSFKDITGFTFKQYILLKRIAHAKNQLYFTDKSITDIAIESGFNSQSNFIRIFKKKEGITPLQFRKIYR